MGRIKTSLVKRITNDIVDLHKEELSKDFEANKEKVEKYAHIPSKKLRNIIAGFTARKIKKSDDI